MGSNSTQAAMPDRILLIQLRRIGDVLMTTPALRALRKARPGAHIAFLTERGSAPVLRNNPHIDEVLEFPRRPGVFASLRWLLRLRRARYDLVLDFFSNPRSAVLTWATGAERRIGFDFPGRRWAYTERVAPPPGRQYAATHKALLLEPLGLFVEDLLPQVFIGEHERATAARQLSDLGVAAGDLLIALCPVSRQPYKVWPAERFATVADHLIERHGAKVLFFWGPGEEHFVEAVRAHMRQAALPGYPVPDLPRMAALLERAALYVGNDNGPRHIAIAVGTPTVAVFGRPFPENWTPPDTPWHKAVAFDPGCKSHCTYPRCTHLDCINGVPLEPVLAAADALIRCIKNERPGGQTPNNKHSDSNRPENND